MIIHFINYRTTYQLQPFNKNRIVHCTVYTLRVFQLWNYFKFNANHFWRRIAYIYILFCRKYAFLEESFLSNDHNRNSIELVPLTSVWQSSAIFLFSHPSAILCPFRVFTSGLLRFFLYYFGVGVSKIFLTTLFAHKESNQREAF